MDRLIAAIVGAGAMGRNLMARVPGAGLARFVLISVDGSRMPTYTNGATFSTALPPDFAFIPIPLAESMPIAAIYLWNGITAISRAEIYDCRLYLEAMNEWAN